MRGVFAWLVALSGLVVVPGAVLGDVPVQGLSMYGCEMHYGVQGVPFAEAGAVLPGGYTPRPFQGLPGGALAAFFVLSQRCDLVTLDDGAVVDDYHDVLHGVLVVPPPEHAGPGIHAVLTGIVTSSAAVAAVYEAWGLTADASGAVLIETLPSGETSDQGLFALGGVAGVSRGVGAFDLAILIESSAVVSGFPGAQFRLHVPDGVGGVSHYAHYDIAPGRVQQGAVQTVFAAGAPFTTFVSGSPGGLYTWRPDQLSQTFALVPLA